MSRAVEAFNRRLLRSRDAMDRAFAEPLDLAALAGIANLSEAHFIRSFRAAFGETPHRYLQRRRVERSMFLLRETEQSVTDVCFTVGFTSLGTFSRTFRDIVGETPSQYRESHEPMVAPNCFQMAVTRPVGVATDRAVLEKPPSLPFPSMGLVSRRQQNHTGERSDDRQGDGHVPQGPRSGRGPRLLRQQARV